MASYTWAFDGEICVAEVIPVYRRLVPRVPFSDLREETEEGSLRIGIGLTTLVLIDESRLWPLPGR